MYLQEGVLRDILDTIDMVKDVSDDGVADTLAGAITRGKKYNSLSAKTQELVATFPVICSDTLSLSTATMISKAIERKCVTMLQLVFAGMSIDQGGDASTTIQQVLAKQHVNIDYRFATVDDVARAIDMAAESTNINDVVDWNHIKQLTENAIKCKEYKGYQLPDALSEYKIERNYKGEKVAINEARTHKDRDNRWDDSKDVIRTSGSNNTNHSYNTTTKTIDSNNTTTTTTNIIKQDNSAKNEVEYFNKQLLSTDVKKANELVPSMLVVKFYQLPDGVTKPIERVAVVGVKARLIPIDSFEIINKIYTKNEDNHGLLKFIKATTKETKFCKDFLFAIDKAKIDALSRSRRGSVSPIWKTLERRAMKQKLRKILGGANDASPITTLVVSQDEVDYLKKHHNIYLDNVKVANQILNAYNLMCIVIVDESIECAKFLFDGDLEAWETLSFSALEREATDQSYKKIINLMNKMV